MAVLALGIFLIGAAGLAIDASTLYAQRQMTQAAADAAAMAGIMSIYKGTYSSGTYGFTNTPAPGASFGCAASDTQIPCYYAQTLNGFNTANDRITVDFPDAAAVGCSGCSLWPVNTGTPPPPVNLLRVTIMRTVNTTLIGLVGGPQASTVTVSATGAIVNVQSIPQVALVQ